MIAKGYENKQTVPMILILLFMVNEYARPAVFVQMKLVLVVQILFLIYIALNRSCFQNSRKFIVLWIVLIAELALHVLIASNNYWAFAIFKTILSYFLFFLMVACFVDSRAKVKVLFASFILINAYCAVIGIKNGGLIIGNAFMKDENDFALAMNIALPIALFFSFSLQGLQRYLLWGTALLMFIAGVLSLSRGGMIGVVVVLFLLWIKSSYKVLSLALLLVGMVIFSYNMPAAYWSEMNSIIEDGTTRGTGRERIEFWKVSTRIFLDNPVVGIGPGNIPFRIDAYKGADPYWQQEGKRAIGGRVVHSLYFTLIAELGLAGILIMAFLLKTAVHHYRVLSISQDKADRLLVNGVTIAGAAFFATGAFLSVLYYPHFWILLALLNALWLNSIRPEPKRSVPA